jgi:hypothetical protein
MWDTSTATVFCSAPAVLAFPCVLGRCSCRWSAVAGASLSSWCRVVLFAERQLCIWSRARGLALVPKQFKCRLSSQFLHQVRSDAVFVVAAFQPKRLAAQPTRKSGVVLVSRYASVFIYIYTCMLPCAVCIPQPCTQGVSRAARRCMPTRCFIPLLPRGAKCRSGEHTCCASPSNDRHRSRTNVPHRETQYDLGILRRIDNRIG